VSAAAPQEPAIDAPGDGGWAWMLDELRFVWREAQSEAATAYRHWCRMRDRTAYGIYRAAQDRADAAQDALSARYRAERARAARAG
jgi:hypothetical protein